MTAKFDVEEALAKLTMSQKIKLLCGKVRFVINYFLNSIALLTYLSYDRDGGTRSPFPRLASILCA